MDDTSSQVIPDIDQTLLQFIDVVQFRLVDSQLRFSTNFAIDPVATWTAGPLVGRYINVDVSRSRMLTDSRLMCWNIKNPLAKDLTQHITHV